MRMNTTLACRASCTSLNRFDTNLDAIEIGAHILFPLIAFSSTFRMYCIRIRICIEVKCDFIIYIWERERGSKSPHTLEFIKRIDDSKNSSAFSQMRKLFPRFLYDEEISTVDIYGNNIYRTAATIAYTNTDDLSVNARLFSRLNLLV